VRLFFGKQSKPPSLVEYKVIIQKSLQYFIQ